ncbi:MAG: IS4 family transposase, partial [Vicinamibacteria bacterium]
MASDFEERYGYRPVLVESFVDASRFKGSSYRAANWKYVGSTSGRGRQDRGHEAALAKKEVFLHPLDPFWSEKLCVEPVRDRKTEEDDENWAEAEFGEARFNDERLTKRLVGIANDFFARPTGSIPEACGERARTKAVYRFCAHENVSMEAILEPHHESTISRAAKEKTILAIQDTTSVNYSAHLATEGLGPIGNCDAQTSLGLYVHSTLALSVAGTPLGLLNVQCWARDPEEHGKSKERKARPVDEKESRKWLMGYLATVEAQRRLKATRIVNVADREADDFELFTLARSEEGSPDLLVRATHPRKIESADPKAPHLWEYVKSLPCEGSLPLVVPRRAARARRETTLEVRFSEVRVRPPKTSRHTSPVKLWAIAVTEAEAEAEKRAPAAREPIEWLLLTTLPVRNLDEAAEKVNWYALRWQIEVFHKTLKSGCRIEDRQLGTADSLEACLAVDMVVAWRIFHLAKLGRETPDAPCTVYFEDAQWKA